MQKAEAKATLDGMDALADLYSFTDMARDSGAPYNIQVDLRGNLASFRQKLNNGGYGNDYAFQTDLMNMMNPLFDAHTLYRGPSGYQCFFLRPFNIEAAVVNNQMQYTLRAGPLGAAGNQIWKNVFGVDPTPLVDQVVSTINSKSVTDHIDVVARNFISTYKDEAVRFNAALRGRWSQTILSMFPITDPNLDYSSTYAMANGQTVTIPNAGFCNPAPTSTQTIIDRNAGKSTKRADIADLPKDPNFLISAFDVHKEHDKLFEEAVASLPANLRALNVRAAERVLASAPTAQTIKIQDYQAIHESMGAEFHDVSGFNIPTRNIPANFAGSSNLRVVASSSKNDTYFMKYNDGVNPPVWIFKLTTFAPGDVTETLNVLNTLLTDAQASGGQRLIADVAYNGGGIICLSDLILAMLVPDWRTLNGPHLESTPFGIYDYKQSKTALAIRSAPQLNNLFTAYTNYLDVKTEKPVTQAFYNPIPRTRAGTTSNYTQQALFPAQCKGYPSATFQAVNYFFKSITVVTDGTCGSACALFASQLQSNNKAKVVSYGGILNRKIPLSTASFAGGNVLEYGTVAMYSFFYGGGVPGLPPMMTSTAAARFNFNEYYEDNELNTPREFLKRPADHHLDFYGTFFASNPFTPLGLANNAALYSAVAQTM